MHAEHKFISPLDRADYEEQGALLSALYLDPSIVNHEHYQEPVIKSPLSRAHYQEPIIKSSLSKARHQEPVQKSRCCLLDTIMTSPQISAPSMMTITS